MTAAASNLVRFPTSVASPVENPASAPRRSPADSTAPELVAPSWLSPAGRRSFKAFAKWVHVEAPDWLAPIDADLLGMALEHLAMAVSASKAMRGPGGAYRPLERDAAHGDRERRKHPAAQVFRDSTNAYIAVVRELGLTPRARRALDIAAGFSGGPEADDDPAGIFDA